MIKIYIYIWKSICNQILSKVELGPCSLRWRWSMKKMEHEELYVMMIYHDNILWWWNIIVIMTIYYDNSPWDHRGRERERDRERELLHVLIHDPRLTSLGSMQLPQPLTGFPPMPCVVIKRNSAEFEAAAAAVAQITVQTCLFRRSKAFW